VLALGRKGLEGSWVEGARYSGEGFAVVVVVGFAVGCGVRAPARRSSVSSSRMAERALGASQGGGEMLARFCRFRRRASQRGRRAGKGGVRGSVGPCGRGREMVRWVMWRRKGTAKDRQVLTLLVMCCDSHLTVRGLGVFVGG
jgi:hypothetical protein